MNLTKMQIFICKIFKLPTWYFESGWKGFFHTYIAWAKGYYKHPIKLFKTHIRHKYYKIKSGNIIKSVSEPYYDDSRDFRDLKIAIVGCTYEMSLNGLYQIYKNHKDEIKTYSKSGGFIRFNDDTYIKAFGINSEQLIRGHKFDQLILFDNKDFKILSFNKQIYDIIKYTMYLTNVPEEYQILLYEEECEEIIDV